MHIIGITGKLGSGKSTLAAMIQSKFEKYLILSFAAELKRIAIEMGWNGIKDEKGRRLLQLLGTECGRECIDENVWVDLWWKRAAKWLEPFSFADNVVVIADDVRFNNEAAKIIQVGGLVVGIIGREGAATQNAASHPSESGIDTKYIDTVFDNSGTIEELQDQVDRFYRRITCSK